MEPRVVAEPQAVAELQAMAEQQAVVEPPRAAESPETRMVSVIESPDWEKLPVEEMAEPGKQRAVQPLIRGVAELLMHSMAKLKKLEMAAGHPEDVASRIGLKKMVGGKEITELLEQIKPSLGQPPPGRIRDIGFRPYPTRLGHGTITG